jgi:hypothetical protein
MPPEAATLPPPAAPAAPAPPAPPSPTQDRTNSPVESPQLESSFDSQFPDADGEDTSPPPAPERRTARPSKPAEKTPEKPAAAPAAPAAAKPADEFALPSEVAESKDLKRVRDFAYGQNKAAKTLEKEKVALTSKLAEIEQTVPKTVAERDALALKIKDFEKRTNDYEERMRFIDFKQSDFYKNDLEKPYISAFNKAATDIAKCPLKYMDGEVEQTRQGTSNDLAYLVGLDRRSARIEAQKHFPDDWQDIMAHYDKVVPLREKMVEEETNYKTKWKQIEQDKTAARATEESQFKEAWGKVNEDLASKNPEFKHRENDTEGNALLDKGFSLADLFFSDNRTKLSFKDRVVLDAHVRNRVAAYPRMERDLKSKDAKIAQLETDIAELRGSRPGAPRPAGTEAPESEEDSDGAESAFSKRF